MSADMWSLKSEGRSIDKCLATCWSL